MLFCHKRRANQVIGYKRVDKVRAVWWPACPYTVQITFTWEDIAASFLEDYFFPSLFFTTLDVVTPPKRSGEVGYVRLNTYTEPL